MFFEKSLSDNQKLYVSPLVIIEIERTQDGKLRSVLVDVMNSYKPQILEETNEILSLAKNYVTNRIIPLKYMNDAIHIAYSTFYEMDAIVSWNMKHIVKMNTRKMVNHINMFEGYKSIDLVTPEEVYDCE